MSRVRLTGSTSGYIEIAAPAVAGNKTVTLPNVTNGEQIVLADSTGALPSPGLLNYVYLTTPGSGTYTPTAGTKRILVEVWGAGGGGGGVDGQTAGTWGKGAPGGGGGYCSKWIAGGLAASYSYTVGAGGAGGIAGANTGSTGESSTFSGAGVSLTANGGNGGNGTTAVDVAAVNGINGGAGGAATGGDLNVKGGSGDVSWNTTPLPRNGLAGESYGFPRSNFTFGIAASSGAAGTAGNNPGEGGTGGVVRDIATNYAGGAGAPGLIKITEYFL